MHRSGDTGGQMQENSLPILGAGARAAARVNLFMAANLHSSGAETAVIIRDLSATGAQIETAVIPHVGSAIILTRGHLAIPGHVTWRAERRCGLHFSARISVQDWMANPVNREQRRVDHMVQAVKAGAVPLAARAPASARPSKPEPALEGSDTAAGVADLARVSQLLESLGDALASDPEVVAKYGTALQNLDISSQMLTALAEAMQADGPDRAACAARLAELRTSCGQALQASA